MSTISLSIISTVTYTKSVGAIVDFDPQFQTLGDLNGTVIAQEPVAIRAISVVDPGLYRYEARTTSTTTLAGDSTVRIFNYGNSDLIISGANFSADGAVPVLDANGEILKNQIPVTLSSGTQYNFNLNYYSDLPGEYNNSFTIFSNDNRGSNVLRVPTRQSVIRDYAFYIVPETTFSTLNLYRQSTSTRYTVYTLDPRDSLATFSVDILNPNQSPGFSVEKRSDTEFDLIFDSNSVNNVNGLYTATVSVSGIVNIVDDPNPTPPRTRFVSSTVNLNIDTSQYQHYNSWISAGSYDNSIVGVSYDMINGEKYLTIGIGSGADGSLEYSQGGLDSLIVDSLGVEYATSGENFLYWSQVYRIPVGSGAGIVLSRDYVAKTSAVDYGSYFGDFASRGSMFIVENDGFDNLKITLNGLRELSGDLSIDTTLQNLTRAFYYYSETDVGGGRITQLGSPTGDGFQTQLFTGFNNQGSITTELVHFEPSNQ